jgi:alcohol dehydrogenase (cytochrome c)
VLRRWSVLFVSLTFAAVLALGAFAQFSGDLISDDWITINKDYSSQRYVDLDQITPANVGSLIEVCEIRLNEPLPFSTGILKVGRTLYVSTARSTVAFDAATCAERWKYTVQFVTHTVSYNNRGSAYLDGNIFRGSPDGQLIALNAATGEKLWSVIAADTNKLETLVSAPIAWQGKVFIGIAIGSLPIAGRLMAFDAATGDKLWTFQLTGSMATLQGGGFWNSYSLDPTTGEVFAPVGNPHPTFNRDIRSNDPENTKYSDSVIVMNAATGNLDWYKQLVPQDDHDWDIAVPPTLYVNANGKKMFAVTGKSGRVYGVDRTSHEETFDTPATTMYNDQVPTPDTWLYVCPGVQGGAQFYGPAYDPLTRMLYTGQNDHCTWYIKGKDFNAGPFGKGGYAVKDWAAAAKLEAPRGWITAIDGSTGAVRWQYHAESQVQAGMVPTKSGLLFAGDTHGHLLIFNAANGTLIKSIDTGGALNSGLISYSVDGVQYVAANVGGPTQNPSTVAGPLRVVIYSIFANGPPGVVTLPRLDLPPPPGITPEHAIFGQACELCHIGEPEGFNVAQISRQSQLANPALLKKFLATVPPPMPRLYPDFVNDNDVDMIAKYLKEKVFLCGDVNQPQSCEPPPIPTSGGTPAWRVIYADLTSPRCINCHPIASPNLPLYPRTDNKSGYVQDYPRQDDDRHPHYFGVLRGDTMPFETLEGTGTVLVGVGAPFERCNSCHGANNDPVTGIPGTHKEDTPNKTFWFLAPELMAWESAPGIPLTGPELCYNLLEKPLNGNRAPKDLLAHIENEPLVNWAFNPGTKPNGEPRTTPPYSHDELIAAFEEWIAEDTPCPGIVPTLSFTVPNQTYGAAPFTVNATSNSTGAITYSVVSGPATISGNTVTLTGIGTVVLQARQAASGDYAGGSIQAGFMVNAAAPTLSFTVPNQIYGVAPFAVNATSNSTGAIAYSVISGPADISGNTVTLTGIGTVVLQASQAAAGNYTAGSIQTSFTVTGETPSFTLTASPRSVSLAQGQTGVVTLTVVGNSTFSGAVSLSASGGPAGTNVAVNPAALTLSGGQSATASVVISTVQPKAGKLDPPGFGSGSQLALAGVGLGLIMLIPLRRRSLMRLLVAAGAFALSLAAIGSISGCGSSGYAVAPPGMGTILVTAKPSKSSVQPQTVNIVVTVN